MIDPVADLMTRIRNAGLAAHESVRIPHSKMKENLTEILKSEGYVTDFEVDGEGVEKQLVVHLRYGADNRHAIRSIRKVSKPGRRVYIQVKDIPRVNQGLGIAIISTSKGVITDREARRLNIGGEVICEIW